MGLFEGLADACFKNDGRGKRLFYKWGFGGKAHVIPDPGLEAEIKRNVSLYYKVLTATGIGLAVFFFNTNWVYAALGAVFLLLTGAYSMKLDSLTKGLDTATEKLTVREGLMTGITNQKNMTLWLASFFFLLAMAGGAYLLLEADDSTGRLIGALNLLFAGAILGSSLYGLLLKKKTKRRQED